MKYFKFKFPEGIKKLPKKIKYEIIEGSFGLIDTTENSNRRLIPELSRLCKEPDPVFFELSNPDATEILKPLKLYGEYQEIPSFMEQTKWDTGIFKLPYDSGTCFFNPGIVRHKGDLLLFTRRYRYITRNFSSHFGVNDLAIFTLNDDLSIIGDRTVPEPPHRYQNEQWEDPRVISTENWGLLIGMATYVQKKSWKIRQSLCQISQGLGIFHVVSEPDYGGNSSNPALGTEHEKNWIWYEDGSEMRCIYTLQPLTVFRMSLNGKPKDEDVERSDSNKWRFGTLRGGTPPIKVGDEWVMFFHSSRPWNDENNRPRRRYYMGALTMSTKPPFKILRVTPNPLLVGSEHDIRDLMSPLVIFPCGSVLEDDTWLVTMGINDERCGWIKIPNQELQKLLKPVCQT